MHQLKVLRCEVCHAPFLFESSLEDHKKEHARRQENDYAFVSKSDAAKPASKKSQTKRKRKSA